MGKNEFRCGQNVPRWASLPSGCCYQVHASALDPGYPGYPPNEGHQDVDWQSCQCRLNVDWSNYVKMIKNDSMNNAKTKSCPKESFLAPLSINRLWTVTSWDESYGSWACRESRSTKGAKVLCMQTLCQLIILLHCYFCVVSLGWKCVDLLTN